MESTGINYLAVFVAAAAYWLLGALWYSKAIFGKTWLEALGKSEEEAKKDHKPINLFWVLIFSFYRPTVLLAFLSGPVSNRSGAHVPSP